jgi:hypothetical protein
MPLAFTSAQIQNVLMIGSHLPVKLHDEYLRAVTRRLDGRVFYDKHVAAAANAALREVVGNHSRQKDLVG